ncbi:AAA family ATPase [Bradyrhizobium sp. BEA-2-5]|uniref:AAA family ATPase n=1 Tax=Bradyrhizobium sp. BEA-2-5 TaxID=3080015 RepID=UPI00293E1746|nr:AAA family ATPase [Bradyrhizobium sp. BEA-2-5]WOH80922.1 AAA family ATPase [Bradyrhizobium sp. BEA-2-5]
MSNSTTAYTRFTLNEYDRFEIARIQHEAPQLAFEKAQLLHEYRNKSYGITRLQSHELRECEALEKRLARSKAEAAIPIRTNDNGRDPSSFRAPSPSPLPEQNNTDEPLTPLDISGWDEAEVPQRDWAVKDRIPRRAVTLLSGEGGVGKSIVTLQLACAHPLARDWFGSLPEPGPAIYLDAEDDEPELHFRLDAIRAHLGVTFKELGDGGLHLMPLAGKDALLGAPDRAGIIQPTPLFTRLLLTANNVKPVLIVLNSAADLFAGNENNRSEVRQFVGLLRRLAIDSGAAVLLTSHPSLSGISTDSGLSGSTAWNNSVRSRLFLKASEPDGDTRSDQRELIVRKNNYGPSGETIRMIWCNGLFVPVTAPSSIERAATERKIEDLFMGLLARFSHEGRKVSDKTGTNYAPAKFADEPEAKAAKCSKQALADAMRRLFAAEKIWVQEDGPPSHRRSRLVIVGGVS